MSEAFEAKKHAYRQTQDGIVVSFVIHPSDMPEHLALAPLGTRFGVAVAEIGDDERPKELAQEQAPSTATNANGKHEGLDSAPAPKDRRPFASLPLSQQAALRCQDNDFKLFLGASNAMDAAGIVRKLCGVSSRSELDEGSNQVERGKWRGLEGEYQAYLTDRQYAGARR